MADYNSKYTGEEVEQLLDQVANGEVGGGGETLTEADIANMGFTKNEGTITEVKMNGVSKGTSGVVDLGNVVQPEDISEFITVEDVARVATSGSYNDLSDKPTIPSAVTESTVSGWGFTKNTGTYSKPSGGIPKSDMASDVQTSLSKSDTAVQREKFDEIEYIQIQGFSGPLSGVLYALPSEANGDEDDVITTRETLKTINGESIIGSGDIAPSGYERKVVFNAGQTCALAVDNKYMLTNILSGQLTIQLPTTNPTSDNYAKECGITFTTGSTAPTIIFNGNIWWVNGTAPTIDANSAYEFSFKFNFANNMWLGVYASFKTA